MKPTYFEIPIGLFNDHPVLIFINHDGNRLMSVYRRWKAPKPQADAIATLAKWWDRQITGADISGVTQVTPEGTVVLLLLPDSDPRGVANAIAHEMVHAAWRVMEAVSIDRNDHTEEILAYLVGHLTGRTMAAIERYAKPKKKK